MNRSLGVTEFIREVLPEWAVPVLQLLSLPGDLLVIVPLLGLLYLWDVGGSLRSHSGEDQSLCSDHTAFLIAVVFGGLALIVLSKAIFSLPRPPETLHAVEPSEYGFPSGHTMAATITWGAMALWTTFGRRRMRIVGATLLVAFVGLSRLGLGVHYLVDVIAAVALATAYLAAAGRLTAVRPSRMFVVAVSIAVGAVLVTGGSSRALLALAGTSGAGVGWWLLERPPVRGQLIRAFDKVVSS